jgi:hypothetical protein
MEKQTLDYPEVFNDGVLQGVLVDGWVGLYWITNERGRLSKTMIKDVLKIERMILGGYPAKGWVCHSEHDHTGMHDVIRGMGGVEFNRDEQGLLFKKEITHVWRRKRKHARQNRNRSSDGGSL